MITLFSILVSTRQNRIYNEHEHKLVLKYNIGIFSLKQLIINNIRYFVLVIINYVFGTNSVMSIIFLIIYGLFAIISLTFMINSSIVKIYYNLNNLGKINIFQKRKGNFVNFFGKYEKILNKCSDKKIRESAIRDLVFVYPRVGEREKARKLAEEQPSMYMCKEHLLEDVLEGEELDELLKGNVISITERFHGIILSMSVKKDPQMKINLMNKYLELMNLVFEGKSMGFYHERMYRSYLSNARNYAKLNQIEESIDNLLYCINHAIKLEASTITKYDQLLLDGLVDDTSKIQTNSTLTNKEFIRSYIYRSDMSLVRESSRFKEVEDLLNKLK